MDFIPNHVARTYANSDAKPSEICDSSADDDRNKAFDPKNDFYYTPGQGFPKCHRVTTPAAMNFKSPLKDGYFDEKPAQSHRERQVHYLHRLSTIGLKPSSQELWC